MAGSGSSPGARRRLQVGVLGLGRMGRFHAENLAGRVARCDLACVSDLDADRGEQVARELGVPFVADPDAVLADGGVDAVVVATPSASHAELSIAAARAGKHTFCEKPISLDHDETLAALEAIERSGVVFQVGLHRRFDPDWVMVADRARGGELGDLYFYRAALRDMSSPPASFLTGSGGMFLDVSLHDLDVARWWMGEVVEVWAQGAVLTDRAFADHGDVDVAVITLRFESGALGVIDNGRSAGYGYESSAEVVGSKASMYIGNRPPHGVESRMPGWRSLAVARDFTERYPLAYRLELEGFAASVLDGAPVRASGWDALAAFELGMAAARSQRAGRPVRTRPHPTAHGVRYDIETDDGLDVGHPAGRT
jgi:myo-inositol 2-dehydrogenase/D-chiro-inositol 1-dehydrogenase